MLVNYIDTAFQCNQFHLPRVIMGAAAGDSIVAASDSGWDGSSTGGDLGLGGAKVRRKVSSYFVTSMQRRNYSYEAARVLYLD